MLLGSTWRPDFHHRITAMVTAAAGVWRLRWTSSVLCALASLNCAWSFSDSAKCWRTKTMKKKKKLVFILLIFAAVISNSHCQIELENGLRITDLWLKALFDWFPQYFPGKLMSTPVLFLPQVSTIQIHQTQSGKCHCVQPCSNWLCVFSSKYCFTLEQSKGRLLNNLSVLRNGERLNLC